MKTVETGSHIALVRAAQTAPGSGVTFDGTGSGSPETDVQAELDRLEGLVGAAAPDDADYLVGTAQAGLSAEIVVGTTPGGELGGTWPSPTVDAVHSGSSHAATAAAAEAAAESYSDAALGGHVAAGDPHTGYRLESADHSHQTTGLQAGQIDHGAALTGLTDDDHTQYVLRSILTTRGDLFRRGAAVIERVGLGVDGRLLASDGTDAVWEAQYGLIQVWLDGGGSALTTGLKLWTSPMARPGVIEAAYLDADVDGAIVVDIGKGTTWAGAHFASICASAKPTITATGGTDLTSTDTTLTGWTTAFAAGDRFSFNIDSITAFTKVMVGLKVRWT